MTLRDLPSMTPIPEGAVQDSLVAPLRLTATSRAAYRTWRIAPRRSSGNGGRAARHQHLRSSSLALGNAPLGSFRLFIQLMNDQLWGVAHAILSAQFEWRD